MYTPDCLHRFLFEHAAIRGGIVHLDATWRAVLERRDYPAPLRNVIGECMAAAALLTASIKFSGKLIMQVQGAGPVELLVVECTSERHLRATARWSGELAPGPLPALFGNARLVMTIAPDDSKENYQGIVALDADSIAHALEDYLQRSEQLDSRLWLTADAQRASGMLLQRMPSVHDEDDRMWEHATILAATLTPTELAELSPPTLLHRLFPEDDLRLYDPDPTCFRCPCSRERVDGVLRMLGQEEVGATLAEQGKVSVECEFCHHRYEFDAVDVEQIFASAAPPLGSPRRH